LNIRIGEAEIPVLGVLGVIGTFAMVAIVLWTHKIARITGPLWVAAWIAYYVWYRHRTGKPIFGNLPRNWDEEQLAILADTGEWELYERFRIELERRKRRRVEAK
jgi:APA family basic amino acid/polyamine antiporter